MMRFLVQRAVGMLVTMFFVSIMVFVIMELPPGDYADRYAFKKYGTGGQTITENGHGEHSRALRTRSASP